MSELRPRALDAAFAQAENDEPLVESSSDS